MRSTLLLFCWGILVITTIESQAQCIENPPGSGNWQSSNGGPCGNALPTAVPFLLITPDARSGGMGDAGVAIASDAASMYFNTALLAYAKSDIGVSLNYSPFLSTPEQTNFFGYLSGHKRIDSLQTLGISTRYFFRNNLPQTDNLSEFEIALGYARRFGRNFSVGMNVKFISSAFPKGAMSGGIDIRPARSGALDLSLFYLLPLNQSDLTFGLTLSNMGPKISYAEGIEDYLPANFALGAAWSFELAGESTLTFTGDLNKLMVPTPQHEFVDVDPQNGLPDYRDKPVFRSMIESWSDAPLGFNEELREVAFSIGAEFWYSQTVAARAGFYHENALKGAKRYFTIGTGIKYRQMNIDISYLINASQTLIIRTTTLDKVFRISLGYEFGG